MLKAILIGLCLGVLLDQAAFDGIYRDKIIGAAVTFGTNLVSQDWALTHT